MKTTTSMKKKQLELSAMTAAALKPTASPLQNLDCTKTTAPFRISSSAESKGEKTDLSKIQFRS